MTLDWRDVGAPDEIPPLGSRVVATPSGPIALFRTADGSIFAMRDRCPHRGGPLSQGIVHGTRVTCPLHGWVIELGTGEAVAPDQGCVPTVPVRIADGRILLRLEPDTQK
jgi:nitrite reductase (NADH) small subunit